MAVGGQILQQTADVDQMLSAGLVAQWRILFAQANETSPADADRGGVAPNGGVAGKRDGDSWRKRCAATVGPQRAGLVSHGEAPDVRFEDLDEAGFGRIHGIVEGTSASGSRMGQYIHATRPGEQAGRTAWGVNLRMTRRYAGKRGQADPGAHHIGAESMAEPMGVGLRNATAQAMMAEQEPQSGGCHGPSPLAAFQRNEQGRGIGERSFESHILFEHFDDFRRQRHHAFLVAFAENPHVGVGELEDPREPEPHRNADRPVTSSPPGRDRERCESCARTGPLLQHTAVHHGVAAISGGAPGSRLGAPGRRRARVWSYRRLEAVVAAGNLLSVMEAAQTTQHAQAR